MPRSLWKGFLKLSLVSVPVKAFSASAGEAAKIHLNQLHGFPGCHSRIQQRKSCPIHGELTADEIIQGYECGKDQYVIIDPKELDKLRTDEDKVVGIQHFFPAGSLDPVYLTGTSMYLVPEGPAGQKGFQLLTRSMQERKLHALANVVLNGKEQILLLRPIGNILAAHKLEYSTQILGPEEFAGDVEPTKLTREEMVLMHELVQDHTVEYAPIEKCKDRYTLRLTKLIECKQKGQEIVGPAQTDEAEPAQVLNLVDAIQAALKKKPKKKVS